MSLAFAIYVFDLKRTSCLLINHPAFGNTVIERNGPDVTFDEVGVAGADVSGTGGAGATNAAIFWRVSSCTFALFAILLSARAFACANFSSVSASDSLSDSSSSGVAS